MNPEGSGQDPVQPQQPQAPQSPMPGAQPAQVPPQQPQAYPQPNPGMPGQQPMGVGEDPGKTLGIVSLVLAVLGVSLIALIVGIIGRNKSKQAGFKNTLATVGIVLSIVEMVLAAVIVFFAVTAGVQTAQKCRDLGPGVHQVGSVTYTCN